MSKFKSVMKAATDIANAADEFQIDPKDFFSVREQGGSVGTQIAQLTASLSEAAQILNSSIPREEEPGEFTNVISPVVMPKDSRSYLWIIVLLGLIFVGIMGLGVSSVISTGVAGFLFGPHYWLLVGFYFVFNLWRNSFVMIPDGCQALITKYGKVEEVVLWRNDKQENYAEKVEAVFVFIGSIPQTQIVKELEVRLDEAGYIVTNQRMETSVPGLYAVGDVRATPFRQLVVAAGEGAIAAHAASQYIDALKGEAYD